MIIKKFPNEEEAKELEGFLYETHIFCRVFPHINNSLEESLIEVNKFLLTNGYRGINSKELDEGLNYENPEETVSISPHGYLEAFVLFITEKEENSNS